MTNIQEMDLQVSAQMQRRARNLFIMIETKQVEDNALTRRKLAEYYSLAYQHLCYAKGWNHMERV